MGVTTYFFSKCKVKNENKVNENNDIKRKRY